MTDLSVLINDRHIGTVSQARNGRFAFRYDDARLSRPDAIPLLPGTGDFGHLSPAFPARTV
ncbi:MAG: hypothetical protein KJ622_12830 [Alphaproteobacteria bacterium]|nr:hypothetical protein [Alphaproteobacteria bacterium]